MSLSNSDAEKIYESLNTVGWDLLTERFEIQFEGVNQVVGCAEAKDMWIRQGQLMVLQQLLMLKEEIQDEMNSADV